MTTPTPQAAWPFPTGATPTTITLDLETTKFPVTAKDISVDVIFWPDLSEVGLNTGELARAHGIKIVHYFDQDNLKGGVTMAYRKSSDFDNCRMVDVAVAYCSPHDTFSKKVGSEVALYAFLDGQTIQVPARVNGDDNSIPYILRGMFSYPL